MIYDDNRCLYVKKQQRFIHYLLCPINRL